MDVASQKNTQERMKLRGILGLDNHNFDSGLWQIIRVTDVLLRVLQSFRLGFVNRFQGLGFRVAVFLWVQR